jgi:hypothetical protein
MPRALRPLSCALLALLALFAHPVHAQLRDDRPRVMLTPARLAALQATGRVGDLRDLAGYVDRRIANPTATATELAGPYPNVICHASVLVAAVLGSTTYVDAARDFLRQVAAVPPASDGDTGSRNRALCLAVGYDWLHDAIPATERATLRDAIVANVDFTRSYVERPDFVAGHTRWGNATALAAAIAMRGDDTRLDATLTLAQRNFETGYNPVLDEIGRDGAHPMGFAYGSAYRSVTPYLTWRAATVAETTWSERALFESAYFHIYAQNGAGEFPLSGDVYNEGLDSDTRDLIATAAMLGNPHAEAFYNALPVAWEPFRVIRMITNPGGLATSPIDALPRSRHFAGSGFFVVRDGWGRTDDTTAVFKSSPFYSYGHHHRDEGSLVIDYRGGLLTEGGAYDSYGSAHHANYYVRSVAHNTLLVRWPEESIRDGAANDGGQRIPPWSSEPNDVDELRTIAALGGLSGTDDTGACVWARANVGPAYASEKVGSYLRDMIEVRRPDGDAHPAFFVVDRATLPVARDAAILWHLVANGAVSGTRITGDNAGGGALTLDILRPAGATFTTFSGADRYRVGSTVYAPTTERSRTTPYLGRVEVAPPAPTTTPVWSTLLRVRESAAPADTRTPVDLGEASWVGTRLGGTLFAVATAPTTRITLPAGTALVDGCIAGLAPGALVDVGITGGSTLRLRADAAGVAVVDPTATLPDTDGGIPMLDAGMMSADGGTSMLDAGTSDTDAGIPALDAGVSDTDAGSPMPDAGDPAMVDAAAPLPDATVAGGCQCGTVGAARSAAPDGSMWALGLALALTARAARRRSRGGR